MDKNMALNIINKISMDMDPYSEGAHSSNKPENNPLTVKAICITLAEIAQHFNDSINVDENIQDYDVINNEYLSLDDVKKINEKETIKQALIKTNYNKTAAAKLLGITFRALRYRIKQYDIE